MLSFKNFLKEALTSPYEHFYAGADMGRSGNTHHYHFYDHNNKSFRVQIYNHGAEGKKGTAEISFEDQHGSIDKTGKSGTHAVRIFSTLRDIMEKHADTHKSLDKYVFSAIKNENNPEGKKDTKAKLYSTLAKVYGGRKTTEGNFFHNYEIPIEREEK